MVCEAVVADCLSRGATAVVPALSLTETTLTLRISVVRGDNFLALEPANLGVVK